MDLIEPRSKDEVVEILRSSSERGTRVSIVGGRTHADKGNPCRVDRELATSGLNRRGRARPSGDVGGRRSGTAVCDLRGILAEGGQEWPVDATDDATVGGTIATASSSPRRLRMGPLRDTVVEMEIVTGDGRSVRSGARTVKSVAGYDVHRLATGSLRDARRDRAGGRQGATAPESAPRGSDIGRRAARGKGVAGGGPASVRRRRDASAGRGRPRRVAGGDRGADGGDPAGDEGHADLRGGGCRRLGRGRRDDGGRGGRPSLEARGGARGRIRLARPGRGRIAWVGLPDAGDRLSAIRERVAEAGGIAPAIRGPGGLGDAPVPALEVHRRLKAAFDPAGILAPGRFWVGCRVTPMLSDRDRRILEAPNFASIATLIVRRLAARVDDMDRGRPRRRRAQHRRGTREDRQHQKRSACVHQRVR